MNDLKRIIYSAPAFSFAIPTLPVIILLPTLYSEKYFLDITSIGLILFSAKIIDIVSDPLMGWITDKNFISRKFWILIGSIICGGSLYNLFIPFMQPNLVYLFICISFLYLGWTIFQVPYLSMGYDLENEYIKRTRISAFREGFVLLGLLSSVTLPFLIKGDIQSESYLVILAISFGIISIFLFCFFIEDRKRKKKTRSKKFEVIKQLKENKYFKSLSFFWFLNNLANVFPMILFIFFVKNILEGNKSDSEEILFYYFLASLFGLPIWIYLSRFFDKHKIWAFSMLFSSIIFSFTFFLESGDLNLFILISCLTGFFLGADLSIPPSIQSDVTDYHKFKFKIDISGINFSFLTFLNKFSFGLGSIFAFSLIGLFDQKDIEENKQLYNLTISFLYAGVPIILKLFTAVKIFNFGLDKSKLEVIKKTLT